MSARVTLLRVLAMIALAAGPAGANGSAVGTPPKKLKAHPFYRKYLSAGGLPVLGSEKVADRALHEAAYLVNQMLARRPDLRKALIAADVRVVVMHPTEMTTDVPEHRHLKPKEFWDRRARGLGGRVTSCGEENLLCYPNDRYRTENILIHEFAHCIHEQGLNRIDKGFDRKLRDLYRKAVAKGLWKGTYAAKNHKEYWAEGVQSWFDTNRQNDHDHNHVNTREELEAHDPALAKLIAAVFGNTKWRYRRPKERKAGAAAETKPAPQFLKQDIEGWVVYINKPALAAHKAVMERALGHLANQLYQIKLVVPAAAVAQTQAVPIWVEYKDKGAAMAFHPRRQWLLTHGHNTPPEGLQSLVGLANVRTFLAYSHHQPWMVLHELSHGYDFVVLGKGRRYGNDVNAAGYRRAMASGKYESVLRHTGRRSKAYGAKNRMEFFAENTEAYFGTNDFFPFVRAELREHDPNTCKMLESLWGVDAGEEARKAKSLLKALETNPFITTARGRPGRQEPTSRKQAYTATGRYRRHEIEGWKVLLHPDLHAKEQTAARMLRLLRYQFHMVKHSLPAKAVTELRRIPVWVEHNSPSVPYVTYHASAEWLAARGGNPHKLGAVEIGSAADYHRWAGLQPWIMLRQLAYGYHQKLPAGDRAAVRAAWRRAVSSGRYNSVLRFDGKRLRHWALIDEREFFVEMTEAMFGTNDHYPFIRVELKEHDPETFRLLAKLWSAEAKLR